MRKLFLLFFILLLCGCQTNTTLKNDLNQLLNNYINDKHYYINHSNSYFNYYLPRGVSLLNANSTNNILLIEGNKVSMSLDIPTIISKNYYQNEPSVVNKQYEEQLFYQKNDVILEIPYTLTIYEVKDYYLINFMIKDFKFSSICKEAYVLPIVKNCLKVGLNSDYNEKKVIVDFSNKGSIDYIKEQVDLFEVIVPKEGKLEDLVNQIIDVEKGE